VDLFFGSATNNESLISCGVKKSAPVLKAEGIFNVVFSWPGF
jgi:hypothetical protein